MLSGEIVLKKPLLLLLFSYVINWSDASPTMHFVVDVHHYMYFVEGIF